MKMLSYKDVKVGNKYFFVDSHFRYYDVLPPTIKVRTVCEIDNHTWFYAQEPNDLYPRQHFVGFCTYEDAHAYASQRLAEYSDYINEKIEDAKRSLMELKNDNR